MVDLVSLLLACILCILLVLNLGLNSLEFHLVVLVLAIVVAITTENFLVRYLASGVAFAVTLVIIASRVARGRLRPVV